ncbi:FMN-binding protein [Thermotalea metallivorans]|uniref:FMN-binding domain-containing protein n=1 Tax=Thermotalea metallivorans TaxID=520762 RepID=A0A140L153_9FIRM|nr:FMN-binding protein [Thermotalea metallivorans]KXG74278.1 hypothetical protein AN619_24700 [Thermotalea metallivorans]
MNLYRNRLLSILLTMGLFLLPACTSLKNSSQESFDQGKNQEASYNNQDEESKIEETAEKEEEKTKTPDIQKEEKSTQTKEETTAKKETSYEKPSTISEKKENIPSNTEKNKSPVVSTNPSVENQLGEKTPQEEAPKQAAPVPIYQDGIYKGSAAGLGGNMEVQVAVADGKIAAIEVLSHGDTENLAKNVFRLLSKEMISKQNPNVDVVAGATKTSEAFMNAVKNALKNALK